jgi:hypothetical protein
MIHYVFAYCAVVFVLGWIRIKEYRKEIGDVRQQSQNYTDHGV